MDMSNLNPVIAQALAPFVQPAPVAAPKKPFYRDEMPSRVAGIPCLIGIRYYNRVEGSFSYMATSDWDYKGYTEVEFDVLDRRGRPAPWLERKMSDAERTLIELEIVAYYELSQC